MSHLSDLLPDSENLRRLVSETHYSRELEVLLHKSLLHPVSDFFGNPGKSIRPKLVEVGFRLAHALEPEITPELREKIQQASAIVEMIHGGSLIVDDIQDGSEERRNQPSMHLKHGMPLALNAGNWLYFWALRSVNKLGLSGIDDLVELMGQAHMGQALDLGVKIDEIPREQVRSTCLVSMELKTGTLLSLALRLGISIADKESRKTEILELGRNLGVILQMFDDFGNFQMRSSKQFEDLMNRRPTWVWAQASETGEEAFARFKQAVKALPETDAIIHWSEEQLFCERLKHSILSEVRALEHTWHERWLHTHPETIELLNGLKNILENSYVKTN